MERQSSFKESGKKMILKTLHRCQSFSHCRTKKPPLSLKTKSWPKSKNPKVAPEGYIAVYVGPGKERFVIKMECLNHPIFVEMLDEAERVYGLDRRGALEFPCDVNEFHRVLSDIEWEVDDRVPVARRSLGRSWSGYQKLTQYSRLLIIER